MRRILSFVLSIVICALFAYCLIRPTMTMGFRQTAQIVKLHRIAAAAMRVFRSSSDEDE